MRSILFLLLILPIAQAAVLEFELSGPITHATQQAVEAALKEAERCDAMLLLLDTPGGDLDATLQVIKSIDRSEVPVLCFVYPRGATAWSAGALILISCHFAAMSPGTLVGSAEPVIYGPEGIVSANHSKLINALIALVTEKAKLHGRNESTAVSFITANLNLDAEQAKQLGVIELVAENVEELLQKANGTKLPGNTELKLGAERVRFEPGIKFQLLNFLSNPLIASLLLLVGAYALAFGLPAPGYGAEIAGAILLILGLIGLGFNVNWLAILLLILGIGLLLAELHTSGFGVLGIGGIVALVLGSLFTLPTTFPRYLISEHFQQQAWLMLSIPSLLLATFLAFACSKAIELRGKKPVVGELKGKVAEVIEAIKPGKIGKVRVEGELWKAESEQRLRPGEKARIVEVKGSKLVVERDR